MNARLVAKRTGLSLASVGFSLVVFELLARGSLPDAYYVWPPNYHRTFELPPDHLQRVRPSTLTINDIGMRGDSPSGDYRHRLLAIGGSTTICAYLDDTEAWPHLVQAAVNGVLGPETLWVGNVGRPGHTTAQQVLQVEKLLEQHPEIDGVLLLIGINDFIRYLQALRPEAPGSRVAESRRRLALRASSDEAALRVAFSMHPGREPEAPWFRRTGIARVLAAAKWNAAEMTGDLRFLDRTGQLYETARAIRRRATFRDGLPELQVGLASYAERVNAIIDAAKGSRVILLTQPTLWRRGLSPDEEELIWGGGPEIDRVTEDSEFYSSEALAAGMRQYNEKLLQVCQERGVECIDAASELPRNGSVFSDDAHFTELGSRMLAELVANHLLTTPPIGNP